MITGIAFYVYPVSDMARARRFYEEVLDLDMTLNRFKQLDVPFVREVFATPVCRMAIVADPDGNHIIVHKRNV